MSYDIGETVDGRCTSPLCTMHEGEYEVSAACHNCGWQGRIVLTKGHTTRHALTSLRCMRCGCTDLMKRWSPS